MKEFFINFAIDTGIKLVVALYKKKGADEVKKFLKAKSLKIDGLLDKSIKNSNSTEIRKILSDMLYEASVEINNPILKRDTSDK